MHRARRGSAPVDALVACVLVPDAAGYAQAAPAPVCTSSWDDSISSPENSPACKVTAGPAPGGKQGAGGDSLDDLLDDLDCIEGSTADPSSVSTRGGSREGGGDVSDTHASGGVQSGGSTRKCFPVYLAGSCDEHGIGPGRGCSNLRCTKCDFEVLRVADRAWKGDVEYLFFRNFYPNLEKLQSKLVKAPGVCARVCACARTRLLLRLLCSCLFRPSCPGCMRGLWVRLPVHPSLFSLHPCSPEVLQSSRKIQYHRKEGSSFLAFDTRAHARRHTCADLQYTLYPHLPTYRR